jgi:hypothetical protein
VSPEGQGYSQEKGLPKSLDGADHSHGVYEYVVPQESQQERIQNCKEYKHNQFLSKWKIAYRHHLVYSLKKTRLYNR